MSHIFQPFQCPSGYQVKGMLVTRRLIFREVLLALNAPPPRCCTGWSGSSYHSSSRRSTSSTYPCPTTKVLSKVFEAWEDGGRSLAPLSFTRVDMDTHQAFPGMMYTPSKSYSIEVAYQQAIKADNAKVPITLWDKHIWETSSICHDALALFHSQWGNTCPLQAIRQALLGLWRSLV